MRLFTGLLTTCLLLASGAQAADTVMRCSHQLPPKHHIAVVIDKWAAEVKSQSGNAIDVQVFGANSLRDAKQNIPAVAKGSPLIEPADFKGVKIRGLNKLVDSGLVALGAAPSAMSGSKVYQALSTGVIDAGLTDISAAYSRKYYEVQDHVTATPLFSVFFHGYVNPAWFDSLSEANQKAIEAAGLKAAQWALEATEKAAADAPDQLREKGMAVHIHTADEIAKLRAIMGPAFDKEFEAATGEDGRRLLDLIANM